MTRQVLKITDGECFTVLHDSEAMPDQAYALYYLVRRLGKDGYYTKRKYLVSKEKNLQGCLAWITDILNDPGTIQYAESRELRSLYWEKIEVDQGSIKVVECSKVERRSRTWIRFTNTE